MLNFITLLHVNRPRYCVRKRVSGSGGRPRRPRHLPPASGPSGQEGELFGITAAAGSPVTASALPRRARDLDRERDEGQRGEVVAERWVYRSAGETPCPGRKTSPHRGNYPSSSGATAERGTGGHRRVRAGYSRGSVPHRKGPGNLARAAEPFQRDRCKAAARAVVLPAGAWAAAGDSEAALGLRRGLLWAAWGAAAEQGGGKWVAAHGTLCRRGGKAVPEPARGLGDACLCAQLA